jgi:hypothetical protein
MVAKGLPVRVIRALSPDAMVAVPAMVAVYIAGAKAILLKGVVLLPVTNVVRVA